MLDELNTYTLQELYKQPIRYCFAWSSTRM